MNDTPDYDDAALTEAADRLAEQARALREQHAQQAADTERQLNEARALVARLEQAALSARGGAYSVDAEAQRMEQRAANYRGAVRLRAQAAEFDQTARDLAAEAEALRGQDASYRERLKQVTAQREQAQTALDAAREAADVAGIAAHTATIGACEQAATALEAQRRPGLERLAAIGAPDGDGELHRALQNAANCRRHVENSLNQADPDRPAAVLARERELTAAALVALAADAAVGRPQQPSSVMLGPDGHSATLARRLG